jgi:hypothetical protein
VPAPISRVETFKNVGHLAFRLSVNPDVVTYLALAGLT